MRFDMDSSASGLKRNCKPTRGVRALRVSSRAVVSEAAWPHGLLTRRERLGWGMGQRPVGLEREEKLDPTFAQREAMGSMMRLT